MELLASALPDMLQCIVRVDELPAGTLAGLRDAQGIPLPLTTGVRFAPTSLPAAANLSFDTQGAATGENGEEAELASESQDQLMEVEEGLPDTRESHPVLLRPIDTGPLIPPSTHAWPSG